MKQEIADIAGLTAGRYNLLYRRSEKHRQLFMQDRFVQSLETDLTLSRRTAYRFCYINDFPMYEYDNEAEEDISLLTIHSQCHRADLKH